VAFGAVSAITGIESRDEQTPRDRALERQCLVVERW
jgi:hypothetical protein